jgi:DNA integrity scanning protein DisA with diadenylate cyclase activity
MDGAIALNGERDQDRCGQRQLMPDPTILSSETGTRHRTAERVSKQTDALVIAVSQRRDVVSLYVDGASTSSRRSRPSSRRPIRRCRRSTSTAPASIRSPPG